MAAARKVIITCAVTGAIHTPSMSPYLPVTPQEIAEAALAACRAWTDGELTDDFAVVVIKRPA